MFHYIVYGFWLLMYFIFYFYCSAAEEIMMPGREDYKATIYSDGSVTYNFPTVLKSVCRIDVTYFPFDTQVCKLTFGSWTHHGYELDVIKRSESGNTDRPSQSQG